MKKMYYNQTYQKLFRKTDCPANLGSEEMFIVPEAQFCSDISQADADRKAEEYAEVQGPAYANRVGGCCKIYYNTKQEADFYKQDCPSGMASEPVHYAVEAGTLYSKYSTELANAEAMKKLMEEGQAAANASDVCKTVYYNQEQHGWFKKKCREGWEGPEKYRRVHAGTVSSFISVEDANNKARSILKEEGQQWVDENTKCAPVVDKCSYEF